MGSEAEPEPEGPATAIDEVQDENLFARLLSRADRLLHIEVQTPMLKEPLRVYYRNLLSGEGPVLDIPPDFPTLPRKARVELIFAHNAETVWAMIEKAQKENASEIPAKYLMSRQTWDGLRRNLPSIYNLIVMEVTGMSDKVADAFFGPPTPPPS